MPPGTGAENKYWNQSELANTSDHQQISRALSFAITVPLFLSRSYSVFDVHATPLQSPRS